MEITEYEPAHKPDDVEKLKQQIAMFVDSVFNKISKTSEVNVEHSDPCWQAIRFFNIDSYGYKQWYQDYLETRGVFQMKVPDESYHIENGAFAEVNPLDANDTVFGFLFMVRTKKSHLC